MTLARRLAAEALGTAFLLAGVVGSGIMGERLAEGNAAIALLANSIATGCGLWVLITIFGPISGAHFNPAVTLALATSGEFDWRDVVPYVLTQVVAAFAGVAAAHMMFELPLFTASEYVGTRGNQHLRGHTSGRHACFCCGAAHRSAARYARCTLVLSDSLPLRFQLDLA